MEYLVDAKKMKQCDQAAIEGLGIPSMVLMERAALAVTEEILKARPQPAPVLVVCGSGNNGGDGFAIARLLAEQKIAVEVLFCRKRCVNDRRMSSSEDNLRELQYKKSSEIFRKRNILLL